MVIRLRQGVILLLFSTLIFQIFNEHVLLCVTLGTGFLILSEILLSEGVGGGGVHRAF